MMCTISKLHGLRDTSSVSSHENNFDEYKIRQDGIVVQRNLFEIYQARPYDELLFAAKDAAESCGKIARQSLALLGDLITLFLGLRRRLLSLFLGLDGRILDGLGGLGHFFSTRLLAALPRLAGVLLKRCHAVLLFAKPTRGRWLESRRHKNKKDGEQELLSHHYDIVMMRNANKSNFIK